MAKACTDIGMLEMADELANGIRDSGFDWRVAESSRRLFIACAALLRDWFQDEDFTPCGMITLLTMAFFHGKYDSELRFKEIESSLDLMFKQIECGVKYVRGENGDWGWHKSKFVRKYDKAVPGDIGGMPLGTDVAASFYASWRCSATPEILEESIVACISQVASLGNLASKAN